MDLKHFYAVKALIQYNDKFLVLKKDDFVGGEYEVPGGRKNVDEADDIALKREVSEETSLDIEIIRQLNDWSLKLVKKGIQLEGKTYFCKSVSDKVILSDEHLSYKWVSKKELKLLDIPLWLKDAILKL